MREEHIAQVFKIGENSGFSYWREEDYVKEIENRDSQCIAALYCSDSEKNVVGFSLAKLIRPEAEIFNIAVDESYRRLGIGKALLDKTVDGLCAKNIELVWLEVRVSNLAAKNLYLKKGFGLAGTRKSYYKNPVEDAELMLYKCNQS